MEHFLLNSGQVPSQHAVKLKKQELRARGVGDDAAEWEAAINNSKDEAALYWEIRKHWGKLSDSLRERIQQAKRPASGERKLASVRAGCLRLQRFCTQYGYTAIRRSSRKDSVAQEGNRLARMLKAWRCQLSNGSWSREMEESLKQTVPEVYALLQGAAFAGLASKASSQIMYMCAASDIESGSDSKDDLSPISPAIPACSSPSHLCQEDDPWRNNGFCQYSAGDDGRCCLV